MPTSLAHAAIPAGILLACAAVPRKSPAHRRTLLVAALVIPNLPDLDLIPAALLPSQWASIHRNWGHNIFTLAVLSLLAARWFSRRCPLMKRGKAYAVATALVWSHILFDSMSISRPGLEQRVGVPLLWPISDWRWVFPWRIFPPVEIGGVGINPLVDVVLSPSLWTRVIPTEVAVTATSFAVTLLAAAAWKATRRRGQHRPDRMADVSAARKGSET